MSDALKLARTLLPRLFLGYGILCVVAAVLFGFGAVLYTHPTPALLVGGVFLLGTKAHDLHRYAAGHIHLAALLHPLTPHF